jgi:hypothetical protein
MFRMIKKVEFCDFYVNLGPEIFSLKMTPLGVILCVKSIESIPDARKRFSDPDSAKKMRKNDRLKIEIFRFSLSIF